MRSDRETRVPGIAARVALVALPSLIGCGSDVASVDAFVPDSAVVATVVEGPIVATVDGEPIALAEVEAVVRETGLTPLAALRRLEEERVLYRRALAASVETRDAERGARRAAVQALLRQRVEAAIGPSTVTDAEIAARYDAQRASFASPERRGSVHVLAQLPEGADEAAQAAAQRFVRRVIAELSQEADPGSAATRYGASQDDRHVFRVVVEAPPPAARTSSYEPPYLAALFSLAAPGVVPTPVQTSNGYHAIVVTSIEPAFRVPLAEAEPLLRRQILAEHRGEALAALERALRERIPVLVDEAVAERVLAADLFDDDESFLGGAPR